MYRMELALIIRMGANGFDKVDYFVIHARFIKQSTGENGFHFLLFFCLSIGVCSFSLPPGLFIKVSY